MADNNLDYIRERMDTIVDRVADATKSVDSLKVTLESHVSKENVFERDLARLADTLGTNTSSLQEHMRRSNLLEDYIKAVDARLSPVELEHLRKKAVNVWVISKLKLIAKIGAAASAIGALGLVARHLMQFLQALP